MELGATLCLPRAPRCEACPVRAHCQALSLGRVGALPPVTPRRRSETVRRAVALIERRGRMLVVRLEGPLLEGMWEPPGVHLAPGRSARRALAAGLAGLGLSARLSPTGRTLRHTITHRDIEVEVWNARLAGPAPRVRRLRFVDPGAPAVPLTALARKLAASRRAL
jgi:A/G-specific adenine glycosylase